MKLMGRRDTQSLVARKKYFFFKPNETRAEPFKIAYLFSVEMPEQNIIHYNFNSVFIVCIDSINLFVCTNKSIAKLSKSFVL